MGVGRRPLALLRRLTPGDEGESVGHIKVKARFRFKVRFKVKVKVQASV